VEEVLEERSLQMCGNIQRERLGRDQTNRLRMERL